MLLSRCCKAHVYVVHHYYVCEQCDFACDAFNKSRHIREDTNDTGSQSKVEGDVIS